jgi:MscS family membrane protein
MISELRLLLALAGIALSIEAPAQLPSPSRSAPASAPQAAEDPLGRTTPHGTVLNFIREVERGNLSRAAEYLDGKVGPKHKEVLALQLKQLMDEGLRVDLNSLSRSATGHTDDGLPLNRETIGEIRIGENSLEILLERAERGTNPPIWLFAAETLLNLRAFPKGEPGVSWIERHLPEVLVENSLWNIALYRWVLVLTILPILAGIAWTATGSLSSLVQRLLKPDSLWRALARGTSFLGPARLLLFAFLLWLVAQLAFTLTVRQYWNHVAVLLVAVGAAWLFMRVVNPLASGYVEYLNRTRQQHRVALVHLLRGLAKIVAVVTVLLVVLSFQGIGLTTAIAGIGIGGIALAFAAQKTLENLFGTVMLVADQPVRVGDFCRLGDTVGTIEDIGLRSTRIRTLDRTIVSVPNGQASSLIVENFAERDKMWFRHVIGLRYETTSDQLRHVLANVRKLLRGHPEVETHSARIRFVKFGGSSLDLEIFAYVLVADYEAYLKTQEELLLRIMDTVEASGTAVAFPSQTMYMAKDPGLGAEKSNAAIAETRQSKIAETIARR